LGAPHFRSGTEELESVDTQVVKRECQRRRLACAPMKRMVFLSAFVTMLCTGAHVARAQGDDDLLHQIAVSPPLVTTTGLRHRVYVPPEYPREAWRRGQEGWVDIELTVNPGGRVTDAKVVASQPRGLFERAALRAVRQWEFEPVRAEVETSADVRGVFRVEFRRSGG
jgi:TonB family protein